MKRKPTALKFTDAEIDGTALKEHTKGEKPKESQAPDPSKKAHRRKKRAAVNHSKKALHFEEERAKKPSKLSHEVKRIPTDTVISSVRSQLREDSEDNVGIESVDTAIGTAQAAGRLSSGPSKRFRESRSTKRSDKSSFQNGIPDESPDPAPKARQKTNIKKNYASQARNSAQNTKSASETASTVVSRIKNGVGKVAEYIGRHKTALAIIAVIALLAVLMLGVASSCSVFVQSGFSGLGISTYPSKDEDMLSAEESYKSLEEALNQSIRDYELTHGYNEYYYNIGEIGHDPYVLISALTAIYGGEWSVNDVSELIQMIFEAQYVLTENVVVETRYYTDYVTEYIWVWDDYWHTYVQIPVTTEIQVPYDYYICTVTLKVKDLEAVVTEMMTEEQRILFNMYMEMMGNRPDLFEE